MCCNGMECTLHPSPLTDSHAASIAVKCWRHKIPGTVPHFKSVMIVGGRSACNQFNAIIIWQGPGVGREKIAVELGGVLCFLIMGVTVEPTAEGTF